MLISEIIREVDSFKIDGLPFNIES